MMNALGSSSKWSSYDSLPSTSSFLLSESEQTEDEADVFSEGEGDSGITKPISSGNYLKFLSHRDPSHSRCRSKQADVCHEEPKHSHSAASLGAVAIGSSSATPGDLVFAQKCADLRRFIHPLLGLVHGLKTGRFEKGLSSFQQSVAIDRLQRILGIIQRPEMGEKYLQNLLQIEVMLKMWFPQKAFQSAETPRQTITPRQLPPHWHQNQLHMPVKKRKLSWSDPDDSGKVPNKHEEHQHGEGGKCQAATSLDSLSTCLPGLPKKLRAQVEDTVEPARGSCIVAVKFTDGAGSLSRLSYLCYKRESENRKQPETSPSSPAQDCSVSSTDTVTTIDSP
ncbi:circadian associated repressor of transcription a [Sparus aurata]|uniref:Circadian associated repressor of transcription a n=1 Tax=Sparus aurata TaxID=8175 RepID=A0A671UHV2_SPAAU|nr:circadian-associated transcriptional repressor-like [Sparus aurata]